MTNQTSCLSIKMNSGNVASLFYIYFHFDLKFGIWLTLILHQMPIKMVLFIKQTVKSIFFVKL